MFAFSATSGADGTYDHADVDAGSSSEEENDVGDGVEEPDEGIGEDAVLSSGADPPEVPKAQPISGNKRRLSRSLDLSSSSVASSRQQRLRPNGANDFKAFHLLVCWRECMCVKDWVRTVC
jgi:hypothetical protein